MKCPMAVELYPMYLTPPALPWLRPSKHLTSNKSIVSNLANQSKPTVEHGITGVIPGKYIDLTDASLIGPNGIEMALHRLLYWMYE